MLNANGETPCGAIVRAGNAWGRADVRDGGLKLAGITGRPPDTIAGCAWW